MMVILMVMMVMPQVMGTAAADLQKKSELAIARGPNSEWIMMLVNEDDGDDWYMVNEDDGDDWYKVNEDDGDGKKSWLIRGL